MLAYSVTSQLKPWPLADMQDRLQQWCLCSGYTMPTLQICVSETPWLYSLPSHEIWVSSAATELLPARELLAVLIYHLLLCLPRYRRQHTLHSVVQLCSQHNGLPWPNQSPYMALGALLRLYQSPEQIYRLDQQAALLCNDAEGLARAYTHLSNNSNFSPDIYWSYSCFSAVYPFQQHPVLGHCHALPATSERILRLRELTLSRHF